MKHTCKRFLAIAMTLAIVLSMLPLSAMAEDAVPHQHNYTSAVTQEATCGAAGVTTFTCSVEGCDRPTYTEAIAATGNHSYAEGVCTVCGAAEPAAHQHNYTSAVTQEATCGAAGVTTFTCAVEGCDRPTYTEPIAATGNHNYAEGVCTVCGGAEHQHNYTSAVTQEATCGAAGVTTFTCAVEGCDRPTYTEAIVAAGNHSYAEGVCTVCGAAGPVCDGTENCAAETHETTCECYDWCAALGCTEEVHHADCPWGPCTLTEGCKLVKGHEGECTGMRAFDANNITTDQDLRTAIVAGGAIKLGADITTTAAFVVSGMTATVDLNGHTLTIGAGDNKFINHANVTFQNGNICITGVTVHGNAIFCLNESAATLSLNNVNLTGNGYSSAYGIFYIGQASTLNVSGGTWNLSNDTHDDGGIFKADSAAAKLNISGLALTAHNVRRVVTHATTGIANSTMSITGDANGVDAQMEHGFNRSALTITNSSIEMKNLLGRGITAENGNVSIEGSTVTMQNVLEATIEVRNNKNLAVDNSNVSVDKPPVVASGSSITGTIERMPAGKFNGGMVNMENINATYLALESKNVYAEESVVIKIYDANNNLLATTSLVDNNKVLLGKDQPVLSTMVCITASDEWWNTVWEADKLRADYVPTYGVLYIDDTEMNKAPIQMNKTSGEQAVNWADVPGVPGVPVAMIGDKTYTTLAEAIEDAVSGDTVKLLQDIELTEAITVPAGKSITLDMNGKTISQSKACTESYAMINNKGNLTITGNGKLSFTDTSAGDPGFGWGSYTVRNEGTLVVENGTIEHLGAQAFATHCIQAIFQYSGSTTINGGTISTPNYRSVRLWKGSMTINGGTFEGQVWVQCVDNSAKMAINGGSFSPKGNDGSSVFVGNSEYEAELSVTGGNFATKIGANDAASLSGSITGGTFTETAKNGTNEVLLNKDFKFQQNANGTYGITAKDYVANIGTTKKYESLQEAVDGAADGETITLLADVTLTAGITADKNLTIDANGHAIKGSNVTLKPASGKTLRLIGLGTNAKLGVDLSANDTATADADGVITVATAGTEYGSMTLLSKDTQTEIISSRKVFVASGTKLVIKSTSTGFDKNTFNGEYMLDMPNKDKVYSATLNADDLYTEYRNYENIYVRGTNNTLTVVSSAFFDTCKRIYVDNSTVYLKETNYSMANVLVARGCTELEMKSGFLTTLATGKHTVKFVHMIDTNGDGVKDECVTTAEFWVKSSGSVADPTCPKTGDYIMIAVGVLGVSVAALAVLLIIRKKKS